MKTNLYRTILLAGVLSFGAAAGFAQTLRATVPFDFQSGAAKMPAGDYTIRALSSATPMVVLNNWKARKSTLIAGMVGLGGLNDSRPRMVFRCADSRCALSEIWGASSAGGIRIAPPRQSRHDDERLSVVYLKK